MYSSILCEDEYIDGELRKKETEKCVGVGMVDLLHQLFKSCLA